MIRKLCAILCALMLLSYIPVAADAPVYPSEFWPLLETYTAALDKKDDAAIRDSARAQIALFEGRTDETAVNIMAYRSYELGNACERLGDWEGARAAFAQAIVYLKQFAAFGYNTDVEVMVAENKVGLFTPTFEAYYGAGTQQVYYGAINEKPMGILWGTNCDGTTRSKNKNESATLIYHSFGVKDSGLNRKMLADAEAAGLAVEYALNLPKEGAQLAEVLNSKKFIMELIDLLNTVDTPIFLRFGAEMNVWQTPADAEAYIKAFRFVADLVHKNTDHVAMVWSPNALSGWMMDVNAFYPGDEYVDWVGVSLYLLRHFNARDNWTRQERIALSCYYSGEAAEPMRIMEELVKTYGDRKPFMIAESGASHTYRMLYGKSVTQKYSDWASEHLAMIYSNLVMTYPQIKVVLHFDNVMKKESADFALGTDTKVGETYRALTKSGAVIQNGQNGTAVFAWAKLADTITVTQGKTEFGAAAYAYGADKITVTFTLDDKVVGTVDKLPYTTTVDLSKAALGAHTLTIRAEAGGRLLGERTCTVNVEKATTVLVGGKTFCTNPKTIGTTVMVELEAFAKALGATVTEDEKTGVITVKSGRTKITLKEGSTELTVSRKTSKMAQPLTELDGKLCISLKDLAAAVGAKVKTDSTAKTITITK